MFKSKSTTKSDWMEMHLGARYAVPLKRKRENKLNVRHVYVGTCTNKPGLLIYLV